VTESQVAVPKKLNGLYDYETNLKKQNFLNNRFYFKSSNEEGYQMCFLVLLEIFGVHILKMLCHLILARIRTK